MWNLFEKIAGYMVFNILQLPISEANWKKILQFFKFAIVGVSNTLIAYMVYVILVKLGFYYLLASVISFLVSVINAYYWNNKYVFQSETNTPWFIVLIRTIIAYAGTGLILNNVLLYFWVDVLNIASLLAPIINIFITTPINFLVNKYWAFKKK